MPPLMGLPAYRIDNALLDFSPVNQGIDSYRQGVADKRNALLADEKMGMLRESHGQDMQTKRDDEKHKFVQRAAGQAQAIDSEADPAKRAQRWQGMIASDPRWAIALQRAGVDPSDHMSGPKFVINAARGYVNPLDDQAKRAEINLKNQHAAYYGNSLKLQNAKADAYARGPEQNSLMQGMGMDSDGNLVPLSEREPSARQGDSSAPAAPWDTPNAGQMNSQGIVGQTFPQQTQSEVLGVGSQNALTSSSQPMQGQVGRLNATVPGIVIDNKGRSDRFATRELAGQDSVGEGSAEQRQRLVDWKATQDRWGHLNGKAAPSGFAYNPDGSLRDLKDEAKKSQGREKIGALIEDVQTANKVLQDTNVVQRGLSHASGGWISPVAEQAARSVEHAVQFMTAEVEGKRHANAQDVRMLRFFAPAWHDSAEMIGFKTDQLNRIMQGYFGAKTPSGDLFKSALSKANAAYQEAVASGKLPAPNVNTKPSPAESGGEMPNNIPTLSDPAEARRLPKGATFRTPDGRIMRNN